MKASVREFARSIGLDAFGVCEPEPGVQALVFPYYNGNLPGTISLYARGMDYHKVAKNYLLLVCAFLKERTGRDFSDKIYCDISPCNDKEIARLAGLGFYGKNTLLINPDFGSYFFIGYILTEGLNMENDVPLKQSCLGCGACISACPGGALDGKGLVQSLCASEISQKKGELSPTQENILLKSGYIWGCDRCQQVCPHNKNLQTTALPEFCTDLLPSLEESDLLPLSEKQFRLKFADRAFAWRGKKPLLRNIEIFKK